MLILLIIAVLIAILDITGFGCTEEVEKIIYSEEAIPSNDTVEKSGEPKEDFNIQEETKKSRKENSVKQSPSSNSDLAKDAEAMLEDVYN